MAAGAPHGIFGPVSSGLPSSGLAGRDVSGRLGTGRSARAAPVTPIRPPPKPQRAGGPGRLARLYAWLLVAALLAGAHVASTPAALAVQTSDAERYRIDHLGKGAPPAHLSARPGLVRADPGGTGGDEGWTTRWYGSLRFAGIGASAPSCGSAVAAPRSNAALVDGARTPTGPPSPIG